MPLTSHLTKFDPEIAGAIQRENQRELSTLNLIASENFASPAVLEAQNSIFYSKLAEGYPGNRFCAGCEQVDIIERLARERAKKLFGADHVNVQCPTATQANLAVYYALLESGDCVLSMGLADGGHFSHGSLMHISSKYYRFIHYGVKAESERIDYEKLEEMAKRYKPKMIIAGGSAYPRQIDFSEFHRISKSVEALLLADIAHLSGFIVTGLHPNPVPFADVVTTSTHKTFRGPRGGGLILCKKRFADQIDKAVFPGTQGAPLINIIAARAVLFKEAMSARFKDYQKQTLLNAKILAEELSKGKIRLVSGGTDTHLILIDLRGLDIKGNEAEETLYSVGIVVNKNLIPFDPEKSDVTSGIRIGTSALTTRGLKEKEMREIAKFIFAVFDNRKDKTNRMEIKKGVEALATRFPLFHREWID